MLLAHAVAVDEDALVCDLCETYHVTDSKALPLRTAAALFVGLSSNSRIMRKLSGRLVDDQTALLAIIADRLGLLFWAQTKDGQRGRNRPKSVYNAMIGRGEQQQKARGYSSAEAFEAARNQILSGKE